MTKRIIFVLLWVATAAVLHLFGNNAGTMAVLVASVGLLVAGGISLIMPWRELSICRGELRSPEHLTITFPYPILVRLFHIACTITCHNRFTGETDTMQMDIHKSPTLFTLHSTHCGHLQIAVSHMQITDPFGIFTRNISCAATYETTIIPTPQPIETPEISAVANPDSNEYSNVKAGMDVSETYAIREYQPGDPIRSIHWKLSGKLDKTMVREFGLPVDNAILLVLDTAKGASVSPSGWNATGEVFYSAMLALVEDGVNVTAGWIAESGEFAKHELHSIEDVQIAMQECLQTLDTSGMLPPLNYAQVITVIADNKPTVARR